MKLFVYNKNADLHCISAREALQHTMGVTELNHLQRYTVWTITFKNGNTASVDTLNTLLSQSYLLSNPNKHHHHVATPPNPTSKYWYVEVTGNDQSEDIDTKTSLNNTFGVDIATLHQNIVWELGFQNDFDATEAFIKQKITMTTDPTHGLLINPLLETARVVKADAL